MKKCTISLSKKNDNGTIHPVFFSKKRIPLFIGRFIQFVLRRKTFSYEVELMDFVKGRFVPYTAINLFFTNISIFESLNSFFGGENV